VWERGRTSWRLRWGRGDRERRRRGRRGRRHGRIDRERRFHRHWCWHRPREHRWSIEDRDLGPACVALGWQRLGIL